MKLTPAETAILGRIIAKAAQPEPVAKKPAPKKPAPKPTPKKPAKK